MAIISNNQIEVSNELSFLINAQIQGVYSNNYILVDKFGLNNDIDTGTVPEDVWAFGGVYNGITTTEAQTLDIVSDSANDANGGTGINTITIEGLDGDYEMVSETINLNGLSAVTTTQTFLRVHRAFGTLSGSLQSNEGNITISQTTSGINMAYILAEKGQTQQAIYTIPAGYTGFLFNIDLEVLRSGTAQSVKFELQRKNFGSNTWRVALNASASNSSPYINNAKGFRSYSEKTDLRLRIIEVTSNNTGISAQFDLILVKNDIIS